jgi:hypothetical protein
LVLADRCLGRPDSQAAKEPPLHHEFNSRWGIPRAAALYGQACDGGEAHGCGNLGFLYETGNGVEKDGARAVALYKQACEGGDAHGCGNLGFMYEAGNGVGKDDARAAALYKQACDGGHASGCTSLSRLRLAETPR